MRGFMSMPLAESYSWVKTLPTTLLKMDQIPLVSVTPSFPWQELVEALRGRFGLSLLSLAPSPWKWLEPEDLFSGLTGSPYQLIFGLRGYSGQISFVCDSQALRPLMGELMHHPLAQGEIDNSYVEGFMRFLAVEVLETLEGLAWEENTSPFLLPGGELKAATHLTKDLLCQLPGYRFHGRIFIEDELRREWIERHKPSFTPDLNSELARAITLPVSVRGGHALFKMSQWQKVRPGDFILLDSCGLAPDGLSGAVTLTVEHIPIFNAVLAAGALQLTEQAIFDEVANFMTSNNDDEDEDFDFEDFNFDEDEDYDFSVDDQEEIATEEEEEQRQEPESQQEEIDTASIEEEAAVPPPHPAPPPPAKEKVSNGKAVPKKAAEKAATLQDIPMMVTVEVARFEMTLEKLMQLQAGNILELNVHPESGIDLIINGRRIGRGELVMLGETLGVRVTEI